MTRDAPFLTLSLALVCKILLYAGLSLKNSGSKGAQKEVTSVLSLEATPFEIWKFYE